MFRTRTWLAGLSAGGLCAAVSSADAVTTTDVLAAWLATAGAVLVVATFPRRRPAPVAVPVRSRHG